MTYKIAEGEKSLLDALEAILAILGGSVDREDGDVEGKDDFSSFPLASKAEQDFVSTINSLGLELIEEREHCVVLEGALSTNAEQELLQAAWNYRSNVTKFSENTWVVSRQSRL